MTARLHKSIEDRDQGFTLIELLVVIIIIGILAAITIPIFLNQRKKGTAASMKSDVRTIANQMETWYTDKRAYPGATDVAAAGTPVQTITFGSGAGAEKAVLSEGNTAVIKTNAATGATAFCIEVANADTSITTIVYRSDAGGPQDSGVTACPGGYGTTIL